MPSFNFDIGEKERVGSRFLSDVRDELQRALASEKSERKITQQEIAEKLGTSRAVINRQIIGLENMGIRRVAEILWAIGWEPHFAAKKTSREQNDFIEVTEVKPQVSAMTATSVQAVLTPPERPKEKAA
jgi:DNA-binding Lrp family transcriptional regulator